MLQFPRFFHLFSFLSRGFLVLLLGLHAGCAEPRHVSDAQMARIDEPAMSLRLDRQDVQHLYETNLESLWKSELAAQWEQSAAGDARAAVGVFPMSNHTGQEIDTALDALLAKFESALIQTDAVDVVSLEHWAELVAETERQQSAAYEPGRVARVGRQIGARYILTGKAFDVAETVEGEERVQYLLVVQVIEVETGAVKFEHRSGLSRALVQ